MAVYSRFDRKMAWPEGNSWPRQESDGQTHSARSTGEYRYERNLFGLIYLDITRKTQRPQPRKEWSKTRAPHKCESSRTSFLPLDELRSKVFHGCRAPFDSMNLTRSKFQDRQRLDQRN